MDREEAIQLLKSGKVGVSKWNEFRGDRSHVRLPDLAGIDLRGANLAGVDLNGVGLCGADLSEAKLHDALLRDARFHDANLSGANLIRSRLVGAKLQRAKLDRTNLSQSDLSAANLSAAQLTHATLFRVNFSDAKLCDANLCSAHVDYAYFFRTDLSGADLRGAQLLGTNFVSCNVCRANLADSVVGLTVWANVDLSQANGLDRMIHKAPSTIGLDTLLRSGDLPDQFLVGCGVQETILPTVRSFHSYLQPIQFYSCFISYSHKDEEFAQRLHGRLRQEGLRIWYAPEDMRGGKKTHHQIDEAIRLHDKLLLVLSEAA